jgi:hypothetical protein
VRRLLIAFLSTPLATLTALWLGQYLFPALQMGWETETAGRWTYSTGRTPLPLLVYILPSKLSIPGAIATYAVMTASLPVLYTLNRLRRTDFMSIAATGVLLGTLALLAFSTSFLTRLPPPQIFASSVFWQAVGLVQLTGLASTTWFWWLGIRGNGLFAGRAAPAPTHEN